MQLFWTNSPDLLLFTMYQQWACRVSETFLNSFLHLNFAQKLKSLVADQLYKSMSLEFWRRVSRMILQVSRKKLILGRSLFLSISSSRLQFASKMSWSGVASPAWKTAYSVFYWSELESSARRSVILSTPSFASISYRILLFSFMRYLNTDSRSDMLWC